MKERLSHLEMGWRSLGTHMTEVRQNGININESHIPWSRARPLWEFWMRASTANSCPPNRRCFQLTVMLSLRDTGAQNPSQMDLQPDEAHQLDCLRGFVREYMKMDVSADGKELELHTDKVTSSKFPI